MEGKNGTSLLWQGDLQVPIAYLQVRECAIYITCLDTPDPWTRIHRHTPDYAIQMHLCQVGRAISSLGTEMRSKFVQDPYFIMVPRDDPNVRHSHWGSNGSIRETIVHLLLTLSV